MTNGNHLDPSNNQANHPQPISNSSTQPNRVYNNRLNMPSKISPDTNRSCQMSNSTSDQQHFQTSYTTPRDGQTYQNYQSNNGYHHLNVDHYNERVMENRRRSNSLQHSQNGNSQHLSESERRISKRERDSSESDSKDDLSYWEKRRKNNESAKRSRDARRIKEEQIAMRVVYLEQENIQLKTEASLLRSEIQKLQSMVYNS